MNTRTEKLKAISKWIHDAKHLYRVEVVTEPLRDKVSFDDSVMDPELFGAASRPLYIVRLPWYVKWDGEKCFVTEDAPPPEEHRPTKTAHSRFKKWLKEMYPGLFKH